MGNRFINKRSGKEGLVFTRPCALDHLSQGRGFTRLPHLSLHGVRLITDTRRPALVKLEVERQTSLEILRNSDTDTTHELGSAHADDQADAHNDKIDD